MLLDGVVDQVVATVDLATDERIDELLLHRGMDRQLVDDLLAELVLGFGLRRLAEPAEQLIHLGVVVGKQIDDVHACYLPTRRVWDTAPTRLPALLSLSCSR